MGKKNITDAFLALKDESILLPKLMAKSVKKHRAIHELRLLFKKMKAHISLFSAISGRDFGFSPGLREYYQQIGRLRDAKIFCDLCKKYTDKNKVFMVLGNERIVHAKQKLDHFISSVDVEQLTKELTELIEAIISTAQNLEPERVKAGLETFLERKENFIRQLLQSPTITDVGIHSVRKQIKKVLYLLPYLALYDTTYTSYYKTYKTFGKQLGDRNDFNLLVKELHPLPRKGKEQKIVSSLVHKEAKMKKKLLKKLRKHFGVSMDSISETTERMNKEITKDIPDGTSKTTASGNKSTTKKPARSTKPKSSGSTRTNTSSTRTKTSKKSVSSSQKKLGSTPTDINQQTST